MVQVINCWNTVAEQPTHRCLPDQTRRPAGGHASAKRKLPSCTLELTEGRNLTASGAGFCRLEALPLLLGCENHEAVKTP